MAPVSRSKNAGVERKGGKGKKEGSPGPLFFLGNLPSFFPSLLILISDKRERGRKGKKKGGEKGKRVDRVDPASFPISYIPNLVRKKRGGKGEGNQTTEGRHSGYQKKKKMLGGGEKRKEKKGKKEGGGLKRK